MTSLDIQLTGKILENERVCEVRAQKPRRRPPSWNFWREMRFGSLDPSFRFLERSQSETSALILKETPRKQGVRCCERVFEENVRQADLLLRKILWRRLWVQVKPLKSSNMSFSVAYHLAQARSRLSSRLEKSAANEHKETLLFLMKALTLASFSSSVK